MYFVFKLTGWRILIDIYFGADGLIYLLVEMNLPYPSH
jgi:hypothetical protein